MNSDRIMNGDIVKTSSGLCEVQIQGYSGAYRWIDGKCENVAIGDHGFLKVLETGECYRAEWKRLTVVKRKFPQLFPNEK